MDTRDAHHEAVTVGGDSSVGHLSGMPKAISILFLSSASGARGVGAFRRRW